ncbi:hypothetical protein LTR08_008492 [Meristemomyces frigidus]|nr:hypothetical protein LTR08_008492 [Meristemomyces frigidus]
MSRHNYAADKPTILTFFAAKEVLHIGDVTPGQINELYDLLRWPTVDELRRKNNLLAWVKRNGVFAQEPPSGTYHPSAVLQESMALPLKMRMGG